ncbi:PHB depolymerase family esterase [Saccharothrix sp.]|uniref:alpha/beta hydrolase family esterase n=1 Tax=Saccharothrix sp. TaxID=1873460 RepID=UPI002811C02C|nr:PHB depolymerase family esterase [Saccharothrix sp.]
MSTVTRLRRSATAVVAIALVPASALMVFPAAKEAQAAQLRQIANFGNNPGDLEMYLYVPDNVPANPAIVVANHWCTGSATDMYNGTRFDELANQYGYIVIYPSVTRSSKCFDVASPASLSGTGGDSVSIKSMVDHTLANVGGDRNRVYATGISSGAMMTKRSTSGPTSTPPTRHRSPPTTRSRTGPAPATAAPAARPRSRRSA